MHNPGILPRTTVGGGERQQTKKVTRLNYFLALALLAAILGLPGSVFAQGSASLSGLVTDNSGAVVPGASIKIRHLSTNVTSQTVSTGAGYYRFPTLPIGEYEVTVDHAGFAQNTQHVIIETARETRQDIRAGRRGNNAGRDRGSGRLAVVARRCDDRHHG